MEATVKIAAAAGSLAETPLLRSFFVFEPGPVSSRRRYWHPGQRGKREDRKVGMMGIRAPPAPQVAPAFSPCLSWALSSGSSWLPVSPSRGPPK